MYLYFVGALCAAILGWYCSLTVVTVAVVFDFELLGVNSVEHFNFFAGMFWRFVECLLGSGCVVLMVFMLPFEWWRLDLCWLLFVLRL